MSESKSKREIQELIDAEFEKYEKGRFKKFSSGLSNRNELIKRFSAALVLLELLDVEGRLVNYKNAYILVAGSDGTVRDYLNGRSMRQGWRWQFLRIYFKKAWKIDYASDTRESFRQNDKAGYMGLEAIGVVQKTHGSSTNASDQEYVVDGDIAKIIAAPVSQHASKIKRFIDSRPQALKEMTDAAETHRTAMEIEIEIKRPAKKIRLSPGPHHKIIKAIVENAVPTYLPKDAQCLQVADTAGHGRGFLNKTLAKKLGIDLTKNPDQRPDVIYYSGNKKLIYCFESVHSGGEFNAARVSGVKDILGTESIVFYSVFASSGPQKRRMKNIAAGTAVIIVDD